MTLISKLKVFPTCIFSYQICGEDPEDYMIEEWESIEVTGEKIPNLPSGEEKMIFGVNEDLPPDVVFRCESGENKALVGVWI